MDRPSREPNTGSTRRSRARRRLSAPALALVGVLVASGSAGSAVTSPEEDSNAPAADGHATGPRASRLVPALAQPESAQPQPVAQRAVLPPQETAPKYGIPATALDAAAPRQ